MVNVEIIKTGTKLGELVEKIKNRTNFIVIDDNGNYVGVLPYDVLIRASFNVDTKIDKFVIRVKPLTRDFDIRDAINRLLNTGIRIVPILDGSDINYISVYDVIEESLELLEEHSIESVKLSKLVTIYEKDNIRKAVNLMKKSKINRLLVVDDRESPVGIITVGDVIRALFVDKKRPRYGEISEKEFNVEVRSFMTTDILDINIEDSVYNAAGLILKHNIYALPVKSKDSYIGWITAKDILRFIKSLLPEKKLYSLHIKGVSLSLGTKIIIERKLDKLVRSFKDILGEDIVVELVIKEISSKPKKFEVSLRMSGSKFFSVVHTINTSIVTAINETLKILQNELSKKKVKSWRKEIFRKVFRKIGI